MDKNQDDLHDSDAPDDDRDLSFLSSEGYGLSRAASQPRRLSEPGHSKVAAFSSRSLVMSVFADSSCLLADRLRPFFSHVSLLDSDAPCPSQIRSELGRYQALDTG
jgi:hypothetical protein